MVDIRSLGEHQLDALREVANIGAGHAATALSQLTNRRIHVEVPRIRFGGLAQLGGSQARQGDLAATVSMQVLGDVTGRTLQVFPTRTARRLAGILTGSAEPGSIEKGLAELEESALKEAGNIIAGAYLNALSDFLGMLLLMSVPTLRVDTASLVSALKERPEADDDLVLCMETEFRMEGEDDPLRGDFILIPDPPSLRVMLEAIDLA